MVRLIGLSRDFPRTMGADMHGQCDCPSKQIGNATIRFTSHTGLDAAGMPIPGKGAPRKNLSIQLSQDSGETWSAPKTLEKGSSAYSDLVVLPDQTVVCLFEAGESIFSARFSLDWVSE